MEKHLNVYSIIDFYNIMEQLQLSDDNVSDHTDIAIVSICNIDKELLGAINAELVYERHYFKENHDNVINLDFDDISGYTEMYYGKKLYGLKDDDAERLEEFIDKNIGRNFYIHCTAGMSRSQGVARFILDMYPQMEYITRSENPCKTPNYHVVTLLKKMFYRKYYGVKNI